MTRPDTIGIVPAAVLHRERSLKAYSSSSYFVKTSTMGDVGSSFTTKARSAISMGKQTRSEDFSPDYCAAANARSPDDAFFVPPGNLLSDHRFPPTSISAGLQNICSIDRRISSKLKVSLRYRREGVIHLNNHARGQLSR